MSNVIEVPPGTDRPHEVPNGYSMKVLDCLSCWRDFRIFTPGEDRLGTILVIDVLCPHCHRWTAETIVPPVSKPVFVQACARSWWEWRQRGMRRAARLARVYARFGLEWPYWAARRIIRRVSAKQASK